MTASDAAIDGPIIRIRPFRGVFLLALLPRKFERAEVRLLQPCIPLRPQPPFEELIVLVVQKLDRVHIVGNSGD